jgi:ABC-type lipoprotein export system ATPase subunit
MALLKRLRDKYQMTTLLVTHDAAVGATADRAYRMRDGRVEPVT